LNNTVLIALAAVILGPLLTYLAAVKRLSGKISTSAADDLWAESKDIREMLQGRNEFLDSKITRLEARIDDLEARNDALYLENGNLRRMIEEHELTIRELREETHHLRLENKRVHASETRLRARVKELEDHNEHG
jgi:predicted RNase H-like nuclease (RuvC/YqgF family)